VRQIEASGTWGFLGIERRFLLRPIPKSQPCGSTGQVFSQQIPQYSPSRYVVIPVALEHKPLRAALFILRKSGFQSTKGGSLARARFARRGLHSVPGEVLI
jgi:hypothetical protein